MRDPDLLVYYRQELDGLVMGGYERRSAPWTATARSFDAVPADFNGKLLEPDWDRFAEIVENAQVRVPVLGDTGVRSMINGPEAFTPDNEFCLGETEVGGFFVAAGFCAHGIAGAGGIGQAMAAWILDGDPGLDLWHMDVRRFGPEYRSPGYTLARVVENYESYYDIRPPGSQRAAGRPLRVSPAYAWHAAHGAVFGEKAGWERVEYYVGSEDTAVGRPAAARLGRARLVAVGRARAPGRARGRRAVRRVVVRQDRDHRAGRGGVRRACVRRPCRRRAGRGHLHPGARRPWRRRDGRDRDPAGRRRVPRRHRHRVRPPRPGAGCATGPSRWSRPFDVRIADVTGAWACFGLWGPRARDVLAPLTPADLSSAAFPYLTMQETTVGDVPVRALRVTYVGELGWELYCPTEYGAGLWRTLVEAGEPHGLRPGGLPGHREPAPGEGLPRVGRRCQPRHDPGRGRGWHSRCARATAMPGPRPGDKALAQARADGTARRLRCLVLADPRTVALGGEPVAGGPGWRSRASSRRAGYGYTVERSIAYALLPVAYRPGAAVEVQVDGQWVGAEVVREPLYDPKGKRIRG